MLDGHGHGVVCDMDHNSPCASSTRTHVLIMLVGETKLFDRRSLGGMYVRGGLFLITLTWLMVLRGTRYMGSPM